MIKGLMREIHGLVTGHYVDIRYNGYDTRRGDIPAWEILRDPKGASNPSKRDQTTSPSFIIGAGDVWLAENAPKWQGDPEGNWITSPTLRVTYNPPHEVINVRQIE